MPDKNIYDILSQLALSVPGVLQQQADVKNQDMLNNLNYGMQKREAKEKSKHTKFMEKLALGQLMQNQKQHEAELGARKEELNANQKPPSLPPGEAGVLEWLKANEPNAYPQYLQALIKAKGGKDDTVGKKSNYIEQANKGYISGLDENTGAGYYKSGLDYFNRNSRNQATAEGLNADSIATTGWPGLSRPNPISLDEVGEISKMLSQGGQNPWGNLDQGGVPAQNQQNNGQISLDAIDALIRQLEQEIGGQ